MTKIHPFPPLLSTAASCCEDHWKKLCECLKEHLNPEMMAHYVDSLEVSYKGDTVQLEVLNVNYYQGFMDYILPVLHKVRAKIKAPIHFQIQIRPRHSGSEKKPSKDSNVLPLNVPSWRAVRSSESANIPRTSGTDRKYSFDNYVKGSCNEFAHAICEKIIHDPGVTYNPLFISAPTGLGKTHLLHAVGNALLQQHPHLPVILTTADNFMSELIYCIRHNKQIQFKQKYHQCSALLVDDIQFISKKRATQEEFFHVFNCLYERKKQIIITSDKYPHEIPDIEERLRNRFQWGLLCDIQVPDHKHRMEILRAKAKKLQVTLDSDVLEYMAAKWNRNIREMEGALCSIVAHAQFHNKAVDQELVARALKVQHFKTIKPDLLTIQKIIARHYGLTPSDLKSTSRQRKFAYPRQVAFYLARELTDASFPEIGHAFGGKDHSTVMYGVKKVAKLLAGSSKLRRDIMHLRQNLYRP